MTPTEMIINYIDAHLEQLACAYLAGNKHIHVATIQLESGELDVITNGMKLPSGAIVVSEFKEAQKHYDGLYAYIARHLRWWERLFW